MRKGGEHKKSNKKSRLRLCTCIYLHRERTDYSFMYRGLRRKEKFSVIKCQNVRRKKSVKVLFFFLEDHGARELPVSIKVILLPRDCPRGAQQADASSSPPPQPHSNLPLVMAPGSWFLVPGDCSWSLLPWRPGYLLPVPGLWSLINALRASSHSRASLRVWLKGAAAGGAGPRVGVG